MKKNLIYLLAFLFIIIINDTIMAQATHYCSMTSADLAEVKRQMMENREELANHVFTRNDVTYVPVRFYLVALSNGTGRATERAGMQAICNLNENYSDQDVQFYLKEFKYLNNNTIYNNPGSFSGSTNIKANMIYNAINIFVVGTDLGGGSGGGIVQAYYQPPAGTNSGANDWIVCNQSFLTDQYVLTHEMGHFLSLPHPFDGWDNTPWDPAVHGNPVLFSTAPEGGQVEKVNGSNCMTAGDGICDTPADYNFGITYSTGCNYTGDARDSNNELLVPLKENVMNYFTCSDQTFTDGQKIEVQNSLNSNNRNYCTPNYTPNTDNIVGPIALIYPNNLETAPNYNFVNLQWEAKDGATHYAVEYNKIGGPLVSQIVESNSLLLTDLDQSSTYFWKVHPFNESFGCAQTSASQIFKTGDMFLATNEVAEIDSWLVAPNPVSSGQSIRVLMEAGESFDADVTLVDLTGKVVKILPNQRFNAGNSTMAIETDDLAAGIYTLAVRSKNGISNKRIAIMK